MGTADMSTKDLVESNRRAGENGRNGWEEIWGVEREG